MIADNGKYVILIFKPDIVARKETMKKDKLAISVFSRITLCMIYMSESYYILNFESAHNWIHNWST